VVLETAESADAESVLDTLAGVLDPRA